MDEQRLAEIRQTLESWPEGHDEYGVWTEWSDRAKPQFSELIDEVRRLQKALDMLMVSIGTL